MDQPPGRLYQLLLIVFVTILQLQEVCPQQQQSADSSLQPSISSPAYFQPSLIGFRCEGAVEQTLDGITVLEANRPVRLTLFGEAFTTNTIIAFTTELAQGADIVDQVITANSAAAKIVESSIGRSVSSSSSARSIVDSHPPANRLQFTSSSPSSSSSSSETESKKNPEPSISNKQARLLAQQANLEVRANQESNNNNNKTKDRKFKRRLLETSKHDCTDYDRVISYKLTEADIVTPNVAVLTVKLPELDSSASYYYFCVKQPPIPTVELELAAKNHRLDESQFLIETSLPLVGANGDALTTTLSPPTDLVDLHSLSPPPVVVAGHGIPQLTRWSSANSSTGTTTTAQPALVWVHQGDEWWLKLRVEPPILSVANDCVLIVLLLFLSAVTSGLNLGLMSLDMNELAVISSCGDQRERSYARTIAPLRKRGNYLLCSLLLGNVMVNSTLTVILEEMTSGVVAVIGSTLAIVVLGEIVPQAFCARQGLAIGAKTIYLTYAFMIITFPLSYPISCLLDCVLGEEKGNVYDRERLMEFIRITGNHTQLEADEVAIISGALKLKKIKVDQIMTRIEDVFMLPIDCMLNRETIKSIIEKGYSRIPVYEFNDRKQIVALILAKDLALLDPDDQVPLASMLMYCKHPLIFIDDFATLDVALNEFKTGKSHMAIVRQIYDDGEVDKYYEAIGVVTLEDVIEEVLQTEINDETDTLSDNRRKRRRADAQVAHLVDNLAQQNPTLASSGVTTGTNSTAKF